MSVYQCFVNGGGVSAQDIRCIDVPDPVELPPVKDKCSQAIYYIDEKAPNTIIIQDLNSTLDKISRYKGYTVVSKIRVFTNYNFIVKTNVTMDVNVRFVNCKFRFDPGIAVGTGFTQSVFLSKVVNCAFYECKLFACDKMWRGISTTLGSRLVMVDCLVEDAQYAIYANGSCNVTAIGNTFNRNYIGIYGRKKAAALGNPNFQRISDNKFTSTSQLNSPYPGQYPKPTSLVSFAGVKFVGINRGVIPNEATNTFDGVGTGIIAIGGNLKFDRWARFLNLNRENNTLHEDEFEYGIEYPLGVGIDARLSNIEFTGFGKEDTDEPTFLNNGYAAIHVISTYLKLEKSKIIWSNKFSGTPVQGIYVENDNGIGLDKAVQIEDNVIKSYSALVLEQAINVTQGVGDIKILRNTIDVGAAFGIATQSGMSGIAALNIDYNVIKLQNANATGIRVSDKSSKFRLLENIVNFDDIGFAGLMLPNCTSGLINLNKFTGPSNVGSDKYAKTGIFVLNSPGNYYCENSVKKFDTGIKFFGNCDKTELKSSTINNNKIGLSIGEPNVGGNNVVRIGEQLRFDNSWIAPSTVVDARCLGNESFSQFIIQNKAVGYPKFPPNVLPNNGVFFKKDKISDENNGCGSSSPPFAIVPEISVFEQELINGNLDTKLSEVQYWEELRWLSRRLLSGAFDGNPENKAIVQSFLDVNSSAYRFEKVHAKIKAAFDYDMTEKTALDITIARLLDEMSVIYANNPLDEDWSDAELQDLSNIHQQIQVAEVALAQFEAAFKAYRSTRINEAFQLNFIASPQKSFEFDEFVLNNIQLQTLLHPDVVLNDGIISELQAIAAKCSTTDGTNVLRARQMLPHCLNIYTDGQCGFTQDVTQYGASRTVKATNGVLVYPNPANQSMTIVFPVGTIQSIDVIDLVGRLQRSIVVDGETSSYTLETADLKNGVYNIALHEKFGLTQNKTVMIQH